MILLAGKFVQRDSTTTPRLRTRREPGGGTEKPPRHGARGRGEGSPKAYRAVRRKTLTECGAKVPVKVLPALSMVNGRGTIFLGFSTLLMSPG